MIVLTVVLGVNDFYALSNSEKTSMSDGIVSGFQLELIFGIGVLALLQIIKLNKVIKDDKKMKMLNNMEHDERLKAIRSKVGMPMLMITSVMILIVAIIAGYFNIVAFYTLVLAAMAQLLIGTIVKLYSMKTT